MFHSFLGNGYIEVKELENFFKALEAVLQGTDTVSAESELRHGQCPLSCRTSVRLILTRVEVCCISYRLLDSVKNR